MSTIFPLSASAGQEFQGYLFDGTRWNLIGGEFNPTSFSSNPPSNPSPGDLWVDSDSDVDILNDTNLASISDLNDYLTISSASTTYATKEELSNIDLSSASAAAVSAIVDSAPSTLNTLNELAAALNDDASFAGTVTTSLSNKIDSSEAYSTFLTSASMQTVPVYVMNSGSSAQRPVSASVGMFRFNTTSETPEWYSASNSAWIPFADPAQYALEIMIIAGGGGGGGSSSDGVAGGGGAGAGGYLFYTNQIATPYAQYTVTVGAGGGGGARGFTGAQGGNSSVTGYTTAIGGGAGRDADDSNVSISNGGSGGGASGSSGGAAGSGTVGQGYDGGTKNDGNAGSFAGGGGGGAGGAASGRTPGPGTANSVTGSLTTWAEGGYGQGTGNFINAATSRTSNTGSGGNGAYNGTSTGGNGGSGIVVIRYQSASQRGSGGTVSSYGGYIIHTFTSSGVFTA